MIPLGALASNSFDFHFFVHKAFFPIHVPSFLEMKLMVVMFDSGRYEKTFCCVFVFSFTIVLWSSVNES